MSGTSNRLKGLNGLSGLSEKEQWEFMNAHADILNQYSNLRNRRKAAEALYMNRQFINEFGEDAFDKFDGSQEAFNLRNQMLKHKVANEEYQHRFKGNLDDDTYNKYMQLSDDGKIELLQSNYLTPKEFDAKWKKHMDSVNSNNNIVGKAIKAIGKGNFWNPLVGGIINDATTLFNSTGDGWADALRVIGSEESGRQHLLEKNNKIIDDIFNNDTKKETQGLSQEVDKAYYDLMDWSDNKVIKEFYKIITPGSYTDENGVKNLGIGPYAAHYTPDHKEVFNAMKDFSIDDMRRTIAKKRVYEANMSLDRAHTALENDAKEYIADHQGKLANLGRFMKDVNISVLSYSADKVNGITELGREGADVLAATGVIDKPTLWIDDNGNVIDPNKVKISQGRGKNGIINYYKDKEGNTHSVHKEQVNYSALHQLGKNADGSDITGMGGIDFLTLNPQYWTRAEQFGTLDEDEQKQYEKLGYSPYKVMNKPGDDGDLMYEAYKMMSFGIADQAAMLLPFGIGKVGKGVQYLGKLGKGANFLSKALNTTGNLLVASTSGKPAQVINGLVGAGGIAYAYGRGTFQETLAQNLANLEEDVLYKAKKNVKDRYDSDKEYKASVDQMIAAEAAKMKKAYLAQMRKDGMQAADMKAIDEVINAKAHDAVIEKMVEQGVTDIKQSKDFATLQQEAIRGAGNAAVTTFLPEAAKYSLVNNLGHRKFLYQNPSGVTRTLSKSLKGLKEITTKDGLKRLATEASKFKTWTQKAKQFGKVTASQAWGGFWTNGTDDMQVDAAERINEDSYKQYLDAFKNGKALATTYGYVDGIYSYLKGLGNSVGQSTTWDAGTVGALGGVVNIAPNFTNIVSLATKKGRQAYKDSFWRTMKRDENGMPIKSEDGKVQYQMYKKKGKDGKTTETDVKKTNNLRGQFNFFVQNGILNTYYGNKMKENDLQNHADYVNGILDRYNDFQDIEGLVASNIASEEYTNPGDAKTMQFLNAIYAMRTLRNLGNNSDDPASMSSVIQKAKSLIDRASRAEETGKNALSEEETKALLGEYYSRNKSVPQSEESAKDALSLMAKNAKILQEADEAVNRQEATIDRYEKARGEKVDPLVRTRLLLNQALNVHWKDRRESMRDEIGDNSSYDAPTDPSVAIATVGGRKNARDLVKVYDKQIEELLALRDKAKAEEAKAKADYEKALKAVSNTKEGSTERIEAEKKAKEIGAKYESIKQDVRFNQNLIDKTLEKRNSFTNNEDTSNLMQSSNDLKLSTTTEELSRFEKELADLKKKKSKYYKKDGSLKKIYSDGEGNAKEQYAKEIAELDKKIEGQENNVRTRTEQINKYKDRVLTSEEIFNLDPVTRAKMMRKTNREFYSKEQQAEIEKLEKELLQKDLDALQKVQDIGLLTQRIDQNEDAIFRIQENPEAAAYAIENERMLASQAAYKLITQHTAETIVDAYNEWNENNKDAPLELREEGIYKSARKLRSDILDIIEEEQMLPQFQKQISDAKEWRKVVEDIDAVIDNSDKDHIDKRVLKQLVDNIIDKANSKEEILATLEKVIDDVDNDDSAAAQDFEFILKGMENLGYQRDATVIESREQRRSRERLEREEREKERKRVEEEAKAAAEKAKEEEERRKAEEEEKNKTYTVNKDVIKALQPEDIKKLYSDGYPKEIDVERDIDEAREMVEEYTNAVAQYLAGKAGVEETLKLLDYSESAIHTKSKDDLQKMLDEEVQRYEKFINKPKAENNSSTAEEDYNRQQAKNAAPITEVAADESNANSAPVDVVDIDASNAELKEWQPGVWNAGILMSDEAGDGNIDAGYMWYGTADNPHKGTFSVEKKGNKITFSLDGKSSTLTVIPSEYDSEGENKGPFEVSSMEKKDGEWYFNGNFVGSKESTQVKVAKSFFLDDAIARQQEDRDTAFAAAGVNTGNNNLVIEGDAIYGKTETVEEQFADASSKGKDVSFSNNVADAEDVNDKAELQETHNTSYLSGTAIPIYDKDALHGEDKKLVKRKGDKEGDALDRYMAWMDAAGIKIQNIVDHELARILQNNPHAKVKFMAVNPKQNATNDHVMKTHLMLVLDYDNSINKDITGIHNEKNGGVIESNGKKYLIIGTVGYGKKGNAEKLALYDILYGNNPHSSNGYGLIRRKFGHFFAEHPTERFYVDEEYSTEIMPNYPVPGWIVKQMENDTESKPRSIKELIEDKDNEGRNPYHLELEDLDWGIQTRSDFMTTGDNASNIMMVRDHEGNVGRSFALVPASNGKKIPIYLKFLKYQEMKDGALKKKVDKYLEEICAPRREEDKEKRVNALKELSHIFYFNHENGNDILLRKNKAELSLVRDGRVWRTYTLDRNFNHDQFLRDFEELNPIVNVSMRVLRDSALRDEWDEAGALMTDSAMLGTAGSSFIIYALDAQGKMIVPENTGNDSFGVNSNEQYRGERKQIIYNHNYYIESNGEFSLNGVKVTNEKTIKQLQYIKRILDGALVPVKSKDSWDYYILNTGDNPEAIKVNRNSKEVKESTKEEAKALIELINKEKAQKAREEAAQKAMEEAKNQGTPDNTEDVELGENGISVDPKTGELITNDTTITETGESGNKDNIDNTLEGTGDSGNGDTNTKNLTGADSNIHSSSEPGGEGSKRGTQRAADIAKSRDYRKEVRKLMQSKFGKIPSTDVELEQLLKSKDIETEGIGTSEKDVKAWLKTIEDCRP
jgi:hypothetical protein